MKTAYPYLKQFAAWATASTDSYRFNPFVRATVNVIVLQVLLVVLTIGIFTLALSYSQDRTVDSVSEHIGQAVRGDEPASLPQTIANVKTTTLSYAFLGIILLAGLFGFLLARYALWPARNSLQFQKRFIGNVAHEIRTPMAIIKTNTEVALMDPSLPADTREVFEETIGELDRMSETINNLLTFDTLVRPERMRPVPVDMGVVTKTVVARHQDLAESRGVALFTQVKDGLIVTGNQTALEQVVGNLLKNAINYTPKDQEKRVDLGVERDLSGRVVVSIADQGIGIAQKDLYHIFEPFYRADSSRARGVGTGSSGLGLAIVNEIVRLHKGSISIRSALGEGTTIKVALPAGKPEEEAPAPVTDDEKLSEVSVDFSNHS